MDLQIWLALSLAFIMANCLVDVQLQDAEAARLQRKTQLDIFGSDQSQFPQNQQLNPVVLPQSNSPTYYCCQQPHTTFLGKKIGISSGKLIEDLVKAKIVDPEKKTVSPMYCAKVSEPSYDGKCHMMDGSKFEHIEAADGSCQMARSGGIPCGDYALVMLKQVSDVLSKKSKKEKSQKNENNDSDDSGSGKGGASGPGNGSDTAPSRAERDTFVQNLYASATRLFWKKVCGMLPGRLPPWMMDICNGPTSQYNPSANNSPNDPLAHPSAADISQATNNAFSPIDPFFSSIMDSPIMDNIPQNNQFANNIYQEHSNMIDGWFSFKAVKVASEPEVQQDRFNFQFYIAACLLTIIAAFFIWKCLPFSCFRKYDNNDPKSHSFLEEI